MTSRVITSATIDPDKKHITVFHRDEARPLGYRTGCRIHVDDLIMNARELIKPRVTSLPEDSGTAQAEPVSRPDDQLDRLVAHVNTLRDLLERIGDELSRIHQENDVLRREKLTFKSDLSAMCRDAENLKAANSALIEENTELRNDLKQLTYERDTQLISTPYGNLRNALAQLERDLEELRAISGGGLHPTIFMAVLETIELRVRQATLVTQALGAFEKGG